MKIRSELKLHAEHRAVMQEAETARSGPPFHPIVGDTSTNVDFMLRQVVKDAAEHGSTHIAIPTGRTVLGYNPGREEGMIGFYDKIVPRRLERLLLQLDGDTKRGVKVDDLKSWTGAPLSGRYDEQGPMNYTQFELTPKAAKNARKGMRLYSVGPGVKLSGEEDD
jgi:hypothetical protein